MSHLPERKEKACLNCGAAIYGRFCHVCGQENIEPKESFWHLVAHFMYDITHFDGKFFSTLKYLLFKPGFLSHEYLRGRRADYLHPIRMYVFTSALFFLIFFSFFQLKEGIKVNEAKPTAARLLKKLEKKRLNLTESLNDSMPLIAQKGIQVAIEASDSDIALIKRDTTAQDRLQTINTSTFNILGETKKDTIYKTVEAYDSMQLVLPASRRDNFLERRFARQKIHLKEKYHGDGKAIWNAILDKFKHLFPQMLFTSLPLFALLLQLLYVRKKNFFYVNHVVYAIHLYCGTFIIILAAMASTGLLHLLGNADPGWLSGIFELAGFFYWYKSMRNFYEQRRGKTILKYLLVLFLSLIIMILLFTIFFIFSAMAI